jgi:hypothetical protein
MLSLYNQGKAPSGITMTIKEWLDLTDLGPLSRRSDPMRAIDDALRTYHQVPEANKDGAFMRLKSSFDQWIAFQQRQGKNWRESDRNKKYKAVEELFNQINLANANRTGPGRTTAEQEAILYVIENEQNALERLFRGHNLEFKRVIRERADKRKQDILREEKIKAVVGPAGKLVRAGHNMVAGTMHIASPDSVKQACTQILGSTPPDTLFHMLGEGSFSTFCSAASGIFGMVASPGALLVDIVKAGMAASTRFTVTGARYNFRPGAADASINAVVQMIDDELKAIAIDAAKQTGSIVASAFGAAPIASAASACVDLMVNIKAYRDMMNQVEAGNRALTDRTLSLDLFNTSPVLGCYFLIMADTSVWINFPMQDIGYPGWKEDVLVMRRRAEPVRDKARELIRKSKIVLEGTEGFNGLEWEPTWRNNKREFFSSGQALVKFKDKTRDKIKDKLGMSTAPPGIPKPPGPLPGNIYGQGPKP